MATNMPPKQQLQHLTRIAAKAKRVSDIAGLAFAFLAQAGLSLDNGYNVAVKPRLNEEEDLEILDIEVLSLKKGGVLLIIKCVQDPSLEERAQCELSYRMMDSNVPLGMIIRPLSTTFFSLDIEDDDSLVETGDSFNNGEFERITTLMVNRIAEIQL